MSNRQVLEHIDRGYRMPRPVECGRRKNFNCPLEIFDLMKACWRRDPESRPTFEFLKSVFEDFFVSVEQQYLDQDNKSN